MHQCSLFLSFSLNWLKGIGFGQIIFTINKTLDELNITKNRLAVEAKIRPNLILELANGDTKAIKIDTLIKILDTLNEIAKNKGLDKEYNVTDIIYYCSKKEPSND